MDHLADEADRRMVARPACGRDGGDRLGRGTIRLHGRERAAGRASSLVLFWPSFPVARSGGEEEGGGGGWRSPAPCVRAQRRVRSALFSRSLLGSASHQRQGGGRSRGGWGRKNPHARGSVPCGVRRGPSPRTRTRDNNKGLPSGTRCRGGRQDCCS